MWEAGNQSERDPSTIMSMLRKAAIWMTTTNLSDCYGTPNFGIKDLREIPAFSWVDADNPKQWVRGALKKYLSVLYSGKTATQCYEELGSVDWKEFGSYM